jgi:hypothetical protein
VKADSSAMVVNDEIDAEADVVVGLFKLFFLGVFPLFLLFVMSVIRGYLVC